jgi:SAM-dependent methyltransferase
MKYRRISLTGKIEPFDSFWEAPKNIEEGYDKFFKFYKYNYLKFIPKVKNISILVVSCGPGYFVNLLKKEGYTKVLGIDSDPEKIKLGRKRGLNCEVMEAFYFLRNSEKKFDLIFCEQEINHLTKDEILEFLRLCWNTLNEGGTLAMHSLNGSNPITGSEALAQNFNHYNTFTEYSLRQVLEYSGFNNIKIIPLKLYVFYTNPLNYMGIFLDAFYTLFFRFNFVFYGKSNKLFTKKIGAICQKRSNIFKR